MQLRTFVTAIAFGWGCAVGWFVTDMKRDLVAERKYTEELKVAKTALENSRIRAENLQATINAINVVNVSQLVDVATKFDGLIERMNDEAKKPANRCRPSPELERMYHSQFAAPGAATASGPN